MIYAFESLIFFSFTLLGSLTALWFGLNLIYYFLKKL